MHVVDMGNAKDEEWDRFGGYENMGWVVGACREISGFLGAWGMR